MEKKVGSQKKFLGKKLTRLKDLFDYE
jgi:hypothetical protein